MDLTFVFPCLNEEETLLGCIREVQQALDGSRVTYEIIVADNGSTDRSAEIAERAGARVIPVSERGYGAAIRGGIAAARGRFVAFADADGSYRLGDVLALFELIEREEADMAIASRMTGPIDPGAMPILHRYLGTPVLTFLINLLFRGHVSDCNSGFRIIRREAYDTWQVRASGMEFASELLIKALKHGSRLVEYSSGLRCDRRNREPHLRTWRDGMRHLLFIFSERPNLFEWLGLTLIILACLLQVIAFRMGLTNFLGFNIFDYHTQAMLIPVGAAGVQLYLFSCSLYVSGRDRPTRLTRMLIGMDEAHVLLILLFMTVLEGTGFSFVFWRWRQSGFANFDMIRFILFMTHFLCVIGFSAVGLLTVHILKRR